jgi:hypothetical protein
MCRQDFLLEFPSLCSQTNAAIKAAFATDALAMSIPTSGSRALTIESFELTLRRTRLVDVVARTLQRAPWNVCLVPRTCSSVDCSPAYLTRIGRTDNVARRAHITYGAGRREDGPAAAAVRNDAARASQRGVDVAAVALRAARLGARLGAARRDVRQRAHRDPQRARRLLRRRLACQCKWRQRLSVGRAAVGVDARRIENVSQQRNNDFVVLYYVFCNHGF